MNGTPDREEVLTINDVDEFPSGMATVYLVGSEDRSKTTVATPDARGYLRTIDDSRAVFRADDWEVLEVVD